MGDNYENKGALAATIVVAASDSLNQGAANFVCDGADDQAEINAAINACALSGRGGLVKLLDGQFNISGTIILQHRVSLHGMSGLDATLITLAANSDCDMIYFQPSADERGWIDLKNFTLDGNSAGQASGHGIHYALNGAFKIYDPVIERVFVKDCKEHGIYVEAAKALVLRDIFVEYNLGDGAFVIADPFFLFNVYAAWNGGNGLRIDGTNYASVGTGLYAAVNTGYGMYLEAQYAKYYGLSVNGNTDHGILAQCYDCTFFGIKTVSTAGGKKSVFATRDSNSYFGVTTDGEFYFSNTADYNLLTGSVLNPLIDLGIGNITKDNNPSSLVDEKDFRYMKNTSGGDLVAGDVVSLKAVAAGNEFTAPAGVGEDQVLGMLAESIANNASGRVQVLGKTILLKATNAGGGNIAIGDFLCTEAGTRARKAAAGDMAFAIALEVCAAADVTIDAYIKSPWA